MTILIKGIEMPQEGTVLVIDSRGEVWVNAWPTRGYIRVDKAKAISVPTPHGRLIDADALKVERPILDGSITVGVSYAITQKEIDEAPTVIEAEEG